MSDTLPPESSPSGGGFTSSPVVPPPETADEEHHERNSSETEVVPVHPMSRIEIPCIVVYNGSSSDPVSPVSPISPVIPCSDRPSRLPFKELCSSDDKSNTDKSGATVACTHTPSATPPDSPCPHSHRGPESWASEGVDVVRSPELPSQYSTDSEKDSIPLVTSARQKHRGDKSKLLQRSHAMREDSSPPPELLESPTSLPPLQGGGNTLTVSAVACGGRRRLRHQGSSSQGSYDGSSPCLSRDSSTDYTDSSGVDLHQFIIQTLHKNQKDRSILLKIEHDLISLVKDAKRTHQKFPPMSSYQRMLVHRCAAFFGLDHNVDQAGTSVVVNKTRSTRLPEFHFRDQCRDDLMTDEPTKRSILKRETASFDDIPYYKGDRQHGGDSRRCKSFEEREEEYEKVRKRIFSQDSLCSTEFGDMPPQSYDPVYSQVYHGAQDEFTWNDGHQQWTFPEVEMQHRKNYYDNHKLRPGRLPKVESFESRVNDNFKSLRPPVFKSHSFGGYSGGVTVLSRGDSVSSNVSSRLSKQDSTCSRLSDHSSSSGYKTQRQDTSSTSVSNTFSTTPSPTAMPHPLPPGQSGWGSHDGGEVQTVMWAVTDLEAVPAGAMLINPQTGQPYVNSDGSLYRFDPTNRQLAFTSPVVKGCDDRIEKGVETGGYQCSGSGPGEAFSTPPSYHSPHSPLTPHDGSTAGITRHTGGSVASPESAVGSLDETCELTESLRRVNSGVEFQAGLSPHAPPPLSQVLFAPFSPHLTPEARSYSQEVPPTTNVSLQMRNLSLDAAGYSETTETVVSTAATSHSYPAGRQMYSQPVYYIPTTHSGGAGMTKYIYPSFPVAPNAQTGVPNMQQAVDHTSGNGLVGPGYTVVTYPTVGNAQDGSQSNATYYYQQVPPMGGGTYSPQVSLGAPVHPSQPQMFSPYSVAAGSANSTYPQLNTPNATYYTTNASGMYPYMCTPNQGSAAPLTYHRAPTPPQAPVTQGMLMKVGMVNGVSNGGGMLISGGASQGGSHYYQPHMSSYSRQGQMIGTSCATQPQTLMPYGTMPPQGPHPPVFGKPYMGPMHTLVPIASDGKEDPRCLMPLPGGGAPGSMPPTTLTGQFLPRAFPFMQTGDVRLFSNQGPLLNPMLPNYTHQYHGSPLVLSSRPRYMPPVIPNFAPVPFCRPPRVRRQRSKANPRSNEVTPQTSLDEFANNE